ncbi:hypothetical protein R6Q59_022789 [Mikania micrantha]
MGTEVLHPQDFFINVAPVIVSKTRNTFCTTTNGCKKPHQPDPEKRGSASGREPDHLMPTCENGDDSYAGPVFVHSPSPRSLPLPSFFNKKQEGLMTMVEDPGGFDDSATKYLCRLLRLG